MPLISTGERPYRDIADVADMFPQIFEKAREDWAKFKVGVAAGLFAPKQKALILDWFLKFPELWEGIEPHFRFGTGGPVAPRWIDFADRVTAWVGKLKASSEKYEGMGLAIIIIVGIAVAAAFGLGGTIWAVGYVQKQNNISRMIDEAVQGNLPAEVLIQAVKAETGSIFSDFGNIIKYGAIAGLLVVFWPQIRRITR